MVLEVLHRPLVLLRGRPRLERTQITTLACLGILLARVQSISTGSEFSNHILSTPDLAES